LPSISKSYFSKKYGPWSLVAGASEGLGAAFVKTLASLGLNIVIVARRESITNQLAFEIKEEFHVETRTIILD